MVPLEQSKWIPKVRLLSHSLYVKVELKMKWPSSTIWIALNGRCGNHRPLDDGFWSNAGKMLSIRWALGIRLPMPRCLFEAWGPNCLWRNAVYWWLWGRRSWWSLCRVSALRRAIGHPTLRRWNGWGLRGLRWILRNRGTWTSLARCGRVCMTPSDARHSWYGWEAEVLSSS